MGGGWVGACGEEGAGGRPRFLGCLGRSLGCSDLGAGVGGVPGGWDVAGWFLLREVSGLIAVSGGWVVVVACGGLDWSALTCVMVLNRLAATLVSALLSSDEGRARVSRIV